MRKLPPWVGALMNTADGAFLVDASQRISSWNANAERLLGVPACNAVGRPCHDVLAGQSPSGRFDCSPTCHVVASVRRHKLVEDFDLLARRGSPEEIRVNVSIIALRMPGGVATLHLVRDASRQQRVADTLASVLRALRGHGVKPDAPGQAPGAGVALTSRQIEVVRALTHGLSTRELALRLGISDHTARHHVQNIFERLGLHRRAQVAAYAVRHGIV